MKLCSAFDNSDFIPNKSDTEMFRTEQSFGTRLKSGLFLFDSQFMIAYGARHEYRSGKAAAEMNYNEKYEIKRIYAVNEKVEIELQPTEILGKNWDREE